MESLGCDAPYDREWRRLRAFRLKERGWYQCDIADALGVSEESVSRWLSRAREGGVKALQARVRPGRPPYLSSQQKRQIPEFLSHGPEAYGLRGEVWTCLRVAKVIEEEFGVSYHKSHVSRLLKDLGWTAQVPIRRAIQRDEAAIRYWREVSWPELRRQAFRQRRVLVFVDESGFYLVPSLVRSYSPQGQTPVIRCKLTRDHLSVMAGMTPEAKIYTLARQETLNGLHSVEFLLHLQRVAGRRLMVIWDGSPIHRRQAVTEFVARMSGTIRLEVLPGYAPDLNPWDEGCWHHLKSVEMRNLVSRDLEELHEQFHLAIARVRQKPRLVRSFFAQAGLKI